MYFDFDEPKAPTGSTFKDMPMEPAVDNDGFIEIFRQTLLFTLVIAGFAGFCFSAWSSLESTKSMVGGSVFVKPISNEV